ncbi:MAG: GWxTD domain-containing protein [Candidatus Marinimicrobia bacterium]|nr:GWxTD domain-containing protein [Candidatus Neomarinimicrobiota bacterium]
MKKNTLILLLALFSFIFASDFRFYADYASYYDNEKSFVELYYMLPRFAMQRQEAPNGDLNGKFLVAVNIFQGEEKVYSKTLMVEDVLPAGDTLRSNDFIPEMFSLHLLPGTYRLNTMVKDMYSNNLSERENTLIVKDYDMSILSISDIEIASFVGYSQNENKFTKLGTYDVVPQANPEFDKYMGTFYTYFEVYKLSPGGIYTFQSSLIDLDGEKVLENKVIESVAPGIYDVIIDYMDIRELAAGIYDYHVMIKDEKSGKIAEAWKHIYMIREAEMDLYVFDEYALYNAGDLDSIFIILRPLMTQNEVKNYRNARLDGKRHLLLEFWKKRDPDLSTAMNEYFIDIMAKINYAYGTYTYLNKGPTSDRGRVLLKYGYPTEIRRSDIGGFIKDHEIWLYEGMRGEIQFVFCDTHGRGMLELIHSNMEGEVYNVNWKDVLKAGAKNY